MNSPPCRCIVLLPAHLILGYNSLMMTFAIFAMRALEVLFFTGLAGSVIVILISFYEDAIELLGKDEPTHHVPEH